MIKKLRVRFTIVVLTGLFLITGGVVAVINYANWISLSQQAKASLQTLSDSGGYRPGLLAPQGDVPPEVGQLPAKGEQGDHPRLGQPHNDLTAYANLSNFYAVELDAQGQVLRWFSDRSELYSDESVTAMVQQVQGEGGEFGRIGTQFYMVTPRPFGTLLVVLEARMELAGAQRLLLTSSLAGVVAFLLLSLGAVWLISRMTRPVQEAFEKQKQFVWDASHELKTPLAVISANAEVLAGEIGENEWLQYIQSEVKRTGQLVQNLLTLARMDGGGRRVGTFDLSHAILSVALPFESAVFEAGKTMTLEVPEGLTYTGDEEMIQQLTVILLSNAMQYADPGGTITLTLSAKGEGRIIRVHNTGPGISPQALPHVFDRFYRADPSRNRETAGSGLGLAIAKTIVAAHKGKIIAESQEGSWAAFTVTLY